MALKPLTSSPRSIQHKNIEERPPSEKHTIVIEKFYKPLLPMRPGKDQAIMARQQTKLLVSSEDLIAATNCLAEPRKKRVA